MSSLEDKESKLSEHPFMWVAEFENGDILDEALDNGEFRSFIAIDKKKVDKFNLIGRGMRTFFDTSTGIFNVNGAEFRFAFVADKKIIPITEIKDKEYKDIIHYKGFFTDAIAFGKNNGSLSTTTNSYHIGWKDKFKIDDEKGFSFRVIFSVILGQGVEFELRVCPNFKIDEAFMLLSIKNSGEEDKVLRSKFESPINKNESKTLKLKLQ